MQERRGGWPSSSVTMTSTAWLTWQRSLTWWVMTLRPSGHWHWSLAYWTLAECTVTNPTRHFYNKTAANILRLYSPRNPVFLCTGSAPRRCQFRFRDGDLRVPEHCSGARVPQDHGCLNPSGSDEEQQGPAEDQETSQEQILDWDLPGKVSPILLLPF